MPQARNTSAGSSSKLDSAEQICFFFLVSLEAYVVFKNLSNQCLLGGLDGSSQALK